MKVNRQELYPETSDSVLWRVYGIDSSSQQEYFKDSATRAGESEFCLLYIIVKRSFEILTVIYDYPKSK